MVLVGCGSAAKPAPPPAGRASCLAEGLGTLRNEAKLDLACAEDGKSCKTACEGGDANGCMLHGYRLQRDEANDEANQQFSRACTLGLAIGCTNFAADMWLGHQPAAAPAVACARALFERACEVREPFGCGMLGRMLAAEAKTPETREVARRFFDKTCTDLGAMSCRMYALHLELGELGAADPATIHALMQRACTTGDDEACGEHATVGETFHE